jgi:hypothetical protein
MTVGMRERPRIDGSYNRERYGLRPRIAACLGAVIAQLRYLMYLGKTLAAMRPATSGNVLPLVILSLTSLRFASASASDQDLSDVFKQLDFNGESMSDYYSLGMRRAGLMINSSTGQRVSQWMSKPVSPTRTDFIWGDPDKWPSDAGKPINIEEWSIKSNCAGGRTFVWLDAFRNDYANSDVHNRFRIATTRAEIRVSNGPWIDITAGGACGFDGQPYALNEVTTGQYSLRAWGNIYKVDNVTVGTRFFWQETMSYVAAARNTCWKTDKSPIRPAIKQEEAWWDSTSGWQPGSGSIGPNREPDGERVNYGRWQMIGKGAGSGWQESDSAEKLCLKYVWVW